MKYLIASDAHGRSELLYSAAELHWDREGVIYLGDGIKDIDESRLTDGNKAFLCVKGNCDLCVSAVYPYPEELLICISEYTVIMVHGHLNGVKSGLENLLVYADKRGANVVLFGHTHTPFEAYFPAGTRIDGHTLTRDMWMFNPGSIGSRSYGLMQIQNGQILFSHGRI